MKKVFLLIVIFNLIIIIIMPYFIINFFSLFINKSQIIEVYNIRTGELMKLDIESYLKGVVAAEMPASFEVEALKAQAVAARTYTLNKVRSSRLTTDSGTDQAWISKEDLLDRWGFRGYLAYWPKISSAVDETTGWALFYEGDLINAVYHSTSGDYTEAAHKVWGNRIPYLESVASSYESQSPHYQRESSYLKSELRDGLGVGLEDLNSIGVSKRSSSGRILEMKVGSNLFTGREVRSRLGLPSTNFILKEDSDHIIFFTSGYGHGVGMSQYGANGMAQQGYNFELILKHYYKGVSLKKAW